MRSFKQHIVFSLSILICYVSTLDGSMAVDSPCGDWEAYKEEKCFKIFDKLGFQTYEEAEKSCHQQENGSSLVSIRFLEEQEFISNLIKTHNIANDVWIGAKYTINKLKWTDNSDLVYTNWAQGSPKNKVDHCVQLNSDETSVGKWSDVLCNKKNLVICQKMQALSLAQLQNILFDIKKNPVPMGFIYVQLPNEKPPTEIWPWMTWNDVSPAYAGIFFRVTGGDAAPFGQVQEDNAPRLVGVRYSTKHNQGEIRTVKGRWSDMVITSKSPSGGGIDNLSFEISGGEVRPRNMAIRIWKRIG